MPTLTIPRLPLIGHERGAVADQVESTAPAAGTLEGVEAPSAGALTPERRTRRQTQRVRRAAAIATTSLVVSAAAIVAARMLAQRYVKRHGLDL